MKHRRIQRKRTKGWRMPPNCVYVGRPSPHENVWKIGASLNDRMMPWVLDAANRCGITIGKPMSRSQVVAMFREQFEANKDSFLSKLLLDKLRGKTLCCWCRLDQPCHADVLIEYLDKMEEP